jgi:hypothetical protein
MLCGEFVERLHVGREAREMHRYDQAGPPGDGRSGRCGREVERIRADIRQDRIQPDIGHGIGRRDEGVG